jgi:hypothetical protein
VPHDIALVEIDKADSVNFPHYFDGFDQTRAPARGQIDLRNVSGDNGFELNPRRQKHFHLLAGSVLRLVENHEGFVVARGRA